MSRLSLLLIVLALSLSACGELVPAAPVPILDATAGPVVTVADQRYESEAFSVVYPVGWTVITSATFTAPYAVFISPDERIVLALAVNADDIAQVAPPLIDGELQRDSAEIDGLTALLVAPIDAEMSALFAAFVESVDRF